MRIVKINIAEIHFERKEYPEILKESIMRIGLSLPIKIKKLENGYECVDGHKRLSIIYDILENYPHLKEVNAIIINNGNNRSNDCWREKNYH